MPADHPGFIYFIGCPKANRIRIGWTAQHPHRRLRAMNCVVPSPLTGFGVMLAENVSEHDLCRKFGEFRTHAAWFDAYRPLRDYIRDHAQPWPERPAGETEEPEGKFVFLERFPPEHRPWGMKECSACGREFGDGDFVTERVCDREFEPEALCDECVGKPCNTNGLRS